MHGPLFVITTTSISRELPMHGPLFVITNNELLVVGTPLLLAV